MILEQFGKPLFSDLGIILMAKKPALKKLTSFAGKDGTGKERTTCPVLLRTLVESFGISGSEESVRNVIEKEIKKYADEIYTDKMGNLIAKVKGAKPKVMLASHMDEVGVVAKSIGPTGRIYFYTVGGIDPASLIGQRVHVVGKPHIRGVVTTAEINDGVPVSSVPKLENLFVDTGYDKAQLKKHGIDVGAFIALEQEFGCLANAGYLYGKALDDRIGCYILIEVIKRASKMKIKEEMNFVFTVQEEIGLYGAKTSAYQVAPDWALVVDVTSTYEEGSARLVGRGPALTIIDSAAIGNKCINDHIINIARKKEVPLQMDVSDTGTTDALSISLSREGVPSTALSIAVKNLHTTVSIAHLEDIENCVKLILEILKNPPTKCIRKNGK